MNILMLGWKYPPKLGRADDFKTLAQELSNVDITYLSTNSAQTDHARVIQLNATTPQEYAMQALLLGTQLNYSIIHAHDYPSARAAIELKKATGRPLIMQMNETTFDRNDGLKNHDEYTVEQTALESADAILASSEKVKDRIIASYNISHDKIITHQELLPTYKKLNNSYVLQGKNETPPQNRQLQTNNEQLNNSKSEVIHHEHAIREPLTPWLKIGLFDFLIGLGLGFVIAMFLLAIA